MELTVDQALRQGVAAHKEGKLQDAERFYRAILQAQPNHPDANHNLGVLAVSVGKPLEAIPLFKLAVDANPQIDQFWLSYVDALIKAERLSDASRVLADAKGSGVAIEALQRLEEQLEFEQPATSQIAYQAVGAPKNVHQAELATAIDLREIGRYREAEEHLNSVIENDPRNAEALSLLSQVLLLDKKEAEAARALKAAASINSELPSVYRNQARLLLKQSKTQKALKKAQEACARSPEDLESLLVLAGCLGAHRKDSDALLLIQKILNVKSNYAEAYANRALIKLRANDTSGAIADAEMTVSLKPHLTQMWQLLSSLHYKSDDLFSAIEALHNAHKNEPRNPDLMIQLGELLRQDNKTNEAINILKRATELAPENANAWTNLGVVFQGEKRTTEAKVAYERALALNPSSAAVANNLGAMAKEAEEWEEALKYFVKAIEVEPELADVYKNLGISIKNIRFNVANRKLYPALAQLLTAGNFIRPIDVAGSILSLLSRDPQIKDLLDTKDFSTSLQETDSIVKNLDQHALLHHLMRACPLPDLQFERFLAALRTALLNNLYQLEVSTELTNFLSTLASHCFINEYIYAETDAELVQIEELQTKVSQTMASLEQPKLMEILCLATYRPIHKYDWCQKLTAFDDLPDLKRRLIEEPLLEEVIAGTIPVLEKVSDDVSLKVKEQYEKNPYPRWVKIGASSKPKSNAPICDQHKPAPF